MPEQPIVADLIESVVKTSNKHLGPLLTTCLTLSAAMGVVGIANCGIPFLPPAGTVAIAFGVMGVIPAIAGIILAWPRGGHVRVLFVLFGTLLLALNGVAIWVGLRSRDGRESGNLLTVVGGSNQGEQ